MEKIIKITNFNQFEAIVEYMEDNPSFARGFNKGVKQIDMKQKWNELASLLNSIGPPTRDGAGWQKVWIDLKGKVKKKLTHNKREVNATGGGVFNQQSLSQLETRVANIMCFKEMLNPVGVVLGATNAATSTASTQLLASNHPPIGTSEDTLLELLSEEEIAENATGTLPSAQRKPKMGQKELLSEQIKLQRNLYHEVQSSLKNIEKYLKESNELQNKLIQLKEENLKLAREKFEWEKEKAEKSAKKKS